MTMTTSKGVLPVRYWSILFGGRGRGGTWTAILYPPFSADWWLPNNTPGEILHHASRRFGREIDSLFLIIS